MRSKVAACKCKDICDWSELITIRPVASEQEPIFSKKIPIGDLTNFCKKKAVTKLLVCPSDDLRAFHEDIRTLAQLF